MHGQGGGGGGLLVDGAGPQASQYQGQGYDGGANGYYTHPDGLPGLILIEVNWAISKIFFIEIIEIKKQDGIDTNNVWTYSDIFWVCLLQWL